MVWIQDESMYDILEEENGKEEEDNNSLYVIIGLLILNMFKK